MNERSDISSRVAKHRRALRAAGLRPVQIWLPDVRSPEFRRAAHLQSLLVAQSEGEAADQEFIDAITVSVDE